MVAHVQGCFAGPLNVQNGRILPREAGGKSGAIDLVFFTGPGHAALNDGRLVEQNIIGHTHAPHG
jgi:hypothetical protein